MSVEPGGGVRCKRRVAIGVRGVLNRAPNNYIRVVQPWVAFSQAFSAACFPTFIGYCFQNKSKSTDVSLDGLLGWFIGRESRPVDVAKVAPFSDSMSPRSSRVDSVSPRNLLMLIVYLCGLRSSRQLALPPAPFSIHKILGLHKAVNGPLDGPYRDTGLGRNCCL
jgi:hypothetical protein